MYKELKSRYILYLFFFAIFLMMPFIDRVYFEQIDVASINRIINPDLYKNASLSYSPYLHHAYLHAFLARYFDSTDNFTRLATVSWLFWNGLSLLAVIALTNRIFKKDGLMLAVAVITFILHMEYQVDQKTMAMPFLFLPVYFLLGGRWLLSAFAGVPIFYIHIGFAAWWFLPWFFTLFMICFKYKKIPIKKFIFYLSLIFIFALPIIYFYLNRFVSGNSNNGFAVKYYYYALWRSSSVVLSALNTNLRSWWTIQILFLTAILLIGYNKAKRLGYKNDSTILLVWGVFFVVVVTFIFADLLHNSIARQLQLLRTAEFYLNPLGLLFLGFLFAKQIRQGNCLLFLMYSFVAYGYGFLRKFLGDNNQNAVLYLTYLAIIGYELSEHYVNAVLNKIARPITYVAKATAKPFQNPLAISVFFIMLVSARLQGVENAIKSLFHIPPHTIAKEMAPQDELFNIIAPYVNERITTGNAYLLVPFLASDFQYHTYRRVFITSDDPFNDIEQDKPSSFKHILLHDLKCPPDAFFRNYGRYIRETWDDLWKNLNEDTIKNLKRKYGLTHVIRENTFPLNFPMVYKGRFYTIYRIP